LAAFRAETQAKLDQLGVDLENRSQDLDRERSLKDEALATVKSLEENLANTSNELASAQQAHLEASNSADATLASERKAREEAEGSLATFRDETQSKLRQLEADLSTRSQAVGKERDLKDDALKSLNTLRDDFAKVTAELDAARTSHKTATSTFDAELATERKAKETAETSLQAYRDETQEKIHQLEVDLEERSRALDKEISIKDDTLTSLSSLRDEFTKLTEDLTSAREALATARDTSETTLAEERKAKVEVSSSLEDALRQITELKADLNEKTRNIRTLELALKKERDAKEEMSITLGTMRAEWEELAEAQRRHRRDLSGKQSFLHVPG
jgi:chromosome segregation ATPase